MFHFIEFNIIIKTNINKLILPRSIVSLSSSYITMVTFDFCGGNCGNYSNKLTNIVFVYEV